MTTSFPPISYPNKPVPPFTAEPPRNQFPGFFPDMWKNITGKPYITVSSKGLANGQSEYFNDGADFGPDSLQADGSLTQTVGIMEAVDYSLANGGDMDIKFIGTTFLIDAPIYKIYDSAQTVHFPNFIGSGLASAGNTSTNVPVTIQCGNSFPSGEYMLAILENGNLGVNVTGWKCEGITLNGKSPNGSTLGAGFSTNCMLYSTVQLMVVNTIAPAPVITTVSGLTTSGAVNIVGNGNSGSTFNYWDISVESCGMDGIYIAGAAEQSILYPRYVSGFYRYGLYANLAGTTAILILNPDIEGSGSNTTSPGGGFPNTSPYMLTSAIYTIINPMQFSTDSNTNGPSFACNNANVAIFGGLLRAGNNSNLLIDMIGGNVVNIYGTQLNFNSSYGYAIGSSAFGDGYPIVLQNVYFNDSNTSSTFTYPIDTSELPNIKIENAYQTNTNYILSSFGSASIAGTKPTLSANPPISGTAYQNTNPFDIRLKIPITYNPTTTAAATLATGISSTSTVTTTTKVSIPAGLTAADGQILTYDMVIPAGWYYELVATNATIGTAEVETA